MADVAEVSNDINQVIALASVGVAALGLIFGPLTALITHRLTRQADEVRFAQERTAEADRWTKGQDTRRIQRGEEAANQILLLVDQAATSLDEDPSLKQKDYRNTYHDLKRLAESLTDDATRDRVLQIASVIYFHWNLDLLREYHVNARDVSHTFREATHAVIHAYLVGRPCPATPRLAKLSGLIDEAANYLDEMSADEAEPGPLDGIPSVIAAQEATTPTRSPTK